MKVRKYFEQNRLTVIVGVTMTLILVTGLAIILPSASRGGTPATKPTPTPTTGVVTPTPIPADNIPTLASEVVLGPQACPAAVKDPAHWDAILGNQGSDRKVEGVSCANVIGTPSLQALVTIRHSNANGTLDVYVFNNITSAKPTQIFKLQGLLKGTAKISGYNTVMTAEVDQNSSANAGKPRSQWTVDIFREFDWDSSKGTLVQVAFPGIFPDLTRYQAEADQALVNSGKETWKNDPQQVAQKLAVKFFKWNRTLKTTVISGGGAKDVYATIKVEEAPVTGTASGPSVTVTLSRLEGNTHNMWVAIAVEGGSLTNIKARSLVASPVRLEGKGSAFEGTIGLAYILDHLYTPVGREIVTGIPGLGMGFSPYSIQVSYDTSFKQGPQEGIVEVLMTSPIEADPYSAVMVKVLLDSQPRVALGPVSCPIALQDPRYWETQFGFSAGTASCGNLKGDPSLQAVVTAYPSGGKPITYMYDHLTDAHPVRIFSLQTDGAMVSGYSTLMTADIDPNSSINKGKSQDQMTTDLFREFKWSAKAGTFVQVAFPGIFPELTRWEAERDQNMVTLGQDTWKNDPKQVAQRLAVKFFKWDPAAPTSILSGGGPKDVNATVQVKSTFFSGGTIHVKLSRLEGNTANMWVAIGVEDAQGFLTITTPKASDRLTSPITIKGTGSAFEGDIGQAYVLDHLYDVIGTARVRGAGMGQTPYTTTVNYNSTFKQGVQEGVVAVYAYSEADGSIWSAVMVKVLLS